MTAQDPESAVIRGEDHTSSSSDYESTASDEQMSPPHGDNGGAVQDQNHQDGVQNRHAAEGSLPIDQQDASNERQEHGTTTSGVEDMQAYNGQLSQVLGSYYTASMRQGHASDRIVADGDDKLLQAYQMIATLKHENRELQAHNVRLIEEIQREQADRLGETKRCQDLERKVERLIQERNATAAQQLTINTFDSSLDRVSEGHIVGEVEALNTSISDLVMNIIDQSASAPRGRPTEEAINSVRTEPLLNLAVKSGMSKDNRELLVDAALHRLIIRHLYPVMFDPHVAPAIPGTDIFEELYCKVISKSEPWKISQRWLSVTASAINGYISPDMWRPSLEQFAQHLVKLVSVGLKRSLEDLQPLNSVLSAGLLSIWMEAARVSISMRRDCISVQMFATMKSSGAPLDETAEVKWDFKDMPGETMDHVLGTYALGVQKIEATGAKATLLRCKVVTDAVLRHASSSS